MYVAIVVVHPMNLAVVVLVGEHQHLTAGITSGQPHVRVSCIACMWHVLVMYPMNLNVVVAADTCIHKKQHTVANIVLMYMYQESSTYVQRANLNNLRRLQKAC